MFFEFSKMVLWVKTNQSAHSDFSTKSGLKQIDSSIDRASGVLPFPTLPKTALHRFSNFWKLSWSIFYRVYTPNESKCAKSEMSKKKAQTKSSLYACTVEGKDFKYTYLETTDNSSFELKAWLFVLPCKFQHIPKLVCFVATFVNKQNTLRVKYSLKEPPQETLILCNSSNALSWSGKFAPCRSASRLHIDRSFYNYVQRSIVWFARDSTVRRFQ